MAAVCRNCGATVEADEFMVGYWIDIARIDVDEPAITCEGTNEPHEVTS